MRYGIFLMFIILIGFLVSNMQNGNTNHGEHFNKETKSMFITITSSKVDSVQLEKVEKLADKNYHKKIIFPYRKED